MTEIAPPMAPDRSAASRRKAPAKRASGPYAGLARLSAPDLRTRYGRILKGVRDDLTRHVGDRPSATQKMLIERAAQLSLRVAMMDDQAATGKALTDHDSRTYLAWSNTLTRTLRQLGLNGAEVGPRSLREHYAAAPT
jgi:hypothetical protein